MAVRKGKGKGNRGVLPEPVMEMAEQDGRGWDLAGRSVKLNE